MTYPTVRSHYFYNSKLREIRMKIVESLINSKIGQFTRLLPSTVFELVKSPG